MGTKPMSKQPEQNLNAVVSGPHKSRVGAKEELTKDLARKIALMVGQFPDTDVPVTWENVIRQTKLRFGRDFKRNVLSQKSWDDKKLIAVAFKEAKAVQKRKARDTSPKYANEPRSRLRLVVAKLQAENMALRDQMNRIRAVQYDEIFALLDTGTPLNRLVAARSAVPAPDAGGIDGEPAHGTILPIDGARAGRGVRGQ